MIYIQRGDFLRWEEVPSLRLWQWTITSCKDGALDSTLEAILLDRYTLRKLFKNA